MPNTVLGKVSMTPRGTYDPAAAYRRLDLVEYMGSGYVALRDVTGVTPAEGENYMLLAAGAKFVTFGVDPATGRLIMYTPDGYSGPEFGVKNGHLEVTV